MSKAPSQVFSLRLHSDEYAALLQAAKNARESPSEYIRHALTLRRENAPRPLAQVGSTLSVSGHTAVHLATWTENRASYDYEVMV